MKNAYLRFIMAGLLVQCALVANGSIFLTVGTTTDGTGTSPLTLRAAIAEANNDPTPADFPYIIQIPAGTYNLTLGELAIGSGVGSGLGSNVMVVGTGTAQNTIINQNGIAHVFDLDPNVVGNSKFAFANLTIDNGSDQDTSSLAYGFGGGGIDTGDGGIGGDELMVTNCIFENNTAQGAPVTGGDSIGGAAISSDGGSAILVGCAFMNNTLLGANNVTFLGGAVDFTAENPGDTLKANGCTFTNNSISGAAGQPSMGGALATYDGGAYGPTANLTDCIFSGNSDAVGSATNQGGGALYAPTDGTNNIVGCAFLSNHVSGATASGGAIQAGGVSAIKFCRFIGNSIPSDGSGSDIINVAPKGGLNVFNANSNWWASDSGPPANAIAGASAPTEWLFLTNTASASAILIGQTNTLTASFLHDSTGNAVPAAALGMLTNLPVAFSGNGGTISGAQTTIQVSGAATANFTVEEAQNDGATATVDGVGSTAAIQVYAGGAPTSVTLQNVSSAKATLTISGNPGLTYHLMASDDMKTWASLGSFTIPSGGSTNFVDTGVPLHTNRFYATKFP